MKCLKSEAISAYLDGELEDKERDSVEFHLASCTRCVHALEEMRSIKTAFKGVERYRAPYAFSTRIMAHIAQQERKKAAWFFPLFVKFAEVAVLLIMIAAGIITGNAMTKGSSVQQTTNITSFFSLDLFDATPPGSLGRTYIAMTEAHDEK